MCVIFLRIIWGLAIKTYSEMFSNFSSVPSAVLAAVASSFPAQSIGPGIDQTSCKPFSIRIKNVTRNNHHLSTVFIAETMFSFARENMSRNLGNVLLIKSALHQDEHM